MSDAQAQIYGYFTDASQANPVFDPGLNVPCPICAHDLDPVDVRTISLNGSRRLPQLLLSRSSDLP